MASVAAGVERSAGIGAVVGSVGFVGIGVVAEVFEFVGVPGIAVGVEGGIPVRV